MDEPRILPTGPPPPLPRRQRWSTELAGDESRRLLALARVLGYRSMSAVVAAALAAWQEAELADPGARDAVQALLDEEDRWNGEAAAKQVRPGRGHLGVVR